MSALAHGHLERLSDFMILRSNLVLVIREATSTVISALFTQPTLVNHLDIKGLHAFDNWQEQILKLDLRFVAAVLLQHLADGPSREAFLGRKPQSVDQGLLDLLQLVSLHPSLPWKQ